MRDNAGMRSLPVPSRFALLALAAVLCAGGHAADGPFPAPLDALAEPDFLPVDEAFALEAELSSDGFVEATWRMPEGYYLYRERFRFDGGRDAELGEPELPAGVAKTDEFFGDVEVYYGSVTARVPVLAQRGERLGVAIEFQGCADYGLCYPPERKHFVFAASGDAAAQASAAVAPGDAGAAVNALLAALGGALLGGLILNLMPCVFPVLSIKALSLLDAEEGERIKHALVYAAGVVTTFLALGAALAGLKSAGEAVGWGFQLQSPGFVAGMAVLFFVLGLNLLGMLETPAFGFGGGASGHFAGGVLAVVVATPCTVPFMGVALGYGLSQPLPVLLGVMIALGVGMALPYVAVAATPPIARRLPRPGPWMVTLKHAMAFPMLITVVWLVWVLARQSGPGAVATTLSACVGAGFIAWLAGGRPERLRSAWAGVAAVAALTIWAAPAGQVEAAAGEDGFDMAVVEQRRAAGKPVFLNFTAAWCITCLANERSTLGTSGIKTFFAQRGIEYIKGDWTNADPAITEALAGFGRSGVPLYVYYPSGGPPVVLPQVLTPGSLIKAIEAADANELSALTSAKLSLSYR